MLIAILAFWFASSPPSPPAPSPQAVEIYLLDFAHANWRHLSRRQETELRAIIHEIVSQTDGTLQEQLQLVNIAALESNFSRTAHGAKHEVGAWQLMPPIPPGSQAREALRRMRTQGMLGYVGCRHPEDVAMYSGGKPVSCQRMIDNRIDRANLYRFAFDP